MVIINKIWQMVAISLFMILQFVNCKLATFDLNDANFEATLHEIMNNKDSLPLFINMLVGECTLGKCPEWSRDIHRVARIAGR